MAAPERAETSEQVELHRLQALEPVTVAELASQQERLDAASVDLAELAQLEVGIGLGKVERFDVAGERKRLVGIQTAAGDEVRRLEAILDGLPAAVQDAERAAHLAGLTNRKAREAELVKQRDAALVAFGDRIADLRSFAATAVAAREDHAAARAAIIESAAAAGVPVPPETDEPEWAPDGIRALVSVIESGRRTPIADAHNRAQHAVAAARQAESSGVDAAVSVMLSDQLTPLNTDSLHLRRVPEHRRAEAVERAKELRRERIREQAERDSVIPSIEEQFDAIGATRSTDHEVTP